MNTYKISADEARLLNIQAAADISHPANFLAWRKANAQAIAQLEAEHLAEIEIGE